MHKYYSYSAAHTCQDQFQMQWTKMNQMNHCQTLPETVQTTKNKLNIFHCLEELECYMLLSNKLDPK